MADISNYIDYAVMHSYAAGNIPSYQLDSLWFPDTLSVCPSNPKPIMATECGYHTYLQDRQQGVSELAQAKYIPRLYFEYFNRGVVRFYTYELIDESGLYPNSPEGFYGIIHWDGSLKPAYTSIKNLITILGERNHPSFTPSTLYATLNPPSNVHYTVMQKSTGIFYVALWQEVSVYNYNSNTDTHNSVVSVTINVATPLASWALYTPRVSASATSSGTGQTITISVPDEVVILVLTPQ
eukprot:Phypoly_transcript_16815.p1 GENE.Phypoly_transcript_16815~~Phypoly_transcript_16815.p1  ORF type:complete len:250 (+),score=27.92 Phypoly_transcript_16815:34-750(+)